MEINNDIIAAEITKKNELNNNIVNMYAIITKINSHFNK